MRHSHTLKIGAVLLAAGLLVASTGCTKKFELVNGISFFSGLMVGINFAPTTVEQTCYENGVLVDCSELPENLGQ